MAIDTDLPQLRADSRALRQVVMNLLSNARDALGLPGTIKIAAFVSRESGDATIDDMLPVPAGLYACIDVVDDGPGMSTEIRRRIFDPFFTTKPTGHGLGLASVIRQLCVRTAAAFGSFHSSAQAHGFKFCGRC